ncbi:MAG: GNAT family N-acetyltransferase [Chitinophagaceae bacterium]|jgi:RimJ/RimL family protein N-acetyltransferase|nr:GNAT family N-acetyltransferase [Chitinophagaceae bacterium]
MNATFVLREWRLQDVKSLVENANNINIWKNVRDYFPHPYTEKDAEKFIQSVIHQPKPYTIFAIEIEGKAVGGIGIIPQEDIYKITTEMGYWLGEKYWNRGIMTRAVKQMVEYTFKKFSVTKIFAAIFEYNTASMKVLEKAGFTKEAILKKAAIKNGKTIDLHYYGLIDNGELIIDNEKRLNC